MTCKDSPCCLQALHVPSDMGRILAGPHCGAAVRKSGSGLPSATATYTAMRKAAAAGVRPSQQVLRASDPPGSSPRRGARNLVQRRSASTGHLVRHKASGEQQYKAPLEVGCLGALVTAWAIGAAGGHAACAMLHMVWSWLGLPCAAQGIRGAAGKSPGAQGAPASFKPCAQVTPASHRG